MGEAIDTITLCILWAGVAWGIVSLLRVVLLEFLKLRLP
jgi:hypothetical protein